VNEPVTAATYGKTLFSLDNVVVQPHAGASTIEVTKHSTIFAVETAYEYCKGQGFGKSSLVRELEESDLTRRPRS
jgi:phosphoglycerate dehydrogenase-like enzyme